MHLDYILLVYHIFIIFTSIYNQEDKYKTIYRMYGTYVKEDVYKNMHKKSVYKNMYIKENMYKKLYTENT